MVIRNNHLEKAKKQLELAYESVPGEEHEYEDDTIALELIERALADAMRVKLDLLPLLGPPDIDALEPQLKPQVARILAVRAVLLFRLDHTDLAAQSARLSARAFRDILDHQFDDEDRYAAYHLHQLLTRPVAAAAFRPSRIADFYEQLFDYYAGLDLLDRAEDMLFHALELTDRPVPLLRRGLEFYDELRNKRRRFLQKRGLPIDEVNLSRSEIIERLQSAEDEAP